MGNVCGTAESDTIAVPPKVVYIHPEMVAENVARINTDLADRRRLHRYLYMQKQDLQQYVDTVAWYHMSGRVSNHLASIKTAIALNISHIKNLEKELQTFQLPFKTLTYASPTGNQPDEPVQIKIVVG